MVQRMIAIRRVYGWIPSFLSIPRTFYGNLLNLHALIRAYHVYYTAPKGQTTSGQPSWDKTDHQFPGSHILTPYRKKIGNLLLEKKIINKNQLNKAILEQQKTGERLGQVLCRLNLISPHELLQLLSRQYHLELIPQSTLIETTKKSDLSIPKHLIHWLIEHSAAAVSVDDVKGILTISIEDPTNELLIEKIINHIKPYKARFVLIDEAS